jgi:ATP citrate (pro-S)-lyase
VNALFQSLVAKPDQLIKRRGKLGLIKVKASLEEVKQWIAERMGKDQEVSSGQSIGIDTVLTVE